MPIASRSPAYGSSGSSACTLSRTPARRRATSAGSPPSAAICASSARSRATAVSAARSPSSRRSSTTTRRPSGVETTSASSDPSRTCPAAARASRTLTVSISSPRVVAVARSGSASAVASPVSPTRCAEPPPTMSMTNVSPTITTTIKIVPILYVGGRHPRADLAPGGEPDDPARAHGCSLACRTPRRETAPTTTHGGGRTHARDRSRAPRPAAPGRQRPPRARAASGRPPGSAL